ncbi:chromosome transmission fidelity protein 18 homolog [Nasonia vitripennis]|uniref:AAA+ ATPase domain-containing protein n=1 Tax=Nasonia vitripennis TaxID=7425 RepID=A0A7M7G523_NASVI|nr:chromosome transmission fidelity protein 18 homolog [Nasonia vitripennis]
MDEFPDPDEFYDLEHADEYEIERELEAEALGTQKSVSKSISQPQQKTNGNQVHSDSQQPVLKHSFEKEIEDIEFQALSGKQNGTSQLAKLSESSRKRSIDQITQGFQLKDFGSFDDDDFDEINLPEKKKPCWNRPKELIELILDRRKNRYDSNDIKSQFEKTVPSKDYKSSISRRVPTWNFVAVTRSEDAERFYIKVSEKKYDPKKYQLKSGSLLKSFDKLKDEAEEILIKNTEKASVLSLEPVSTENINSELWVDKYRPKRYVELLSDENVNRSLLYWLKLWDKVVFDREPTVHRKKSNVVSKFRNKFIQKEDIPDHDSKGFPTQRIALLTGPPGLGKTTLAHVAARHAGYNIVELNASDDRGPEAFREALLASTQMRALIDQDRRPNCLILDEIDGAPTASIELLLKFIHGKLAPKGKNAKPGKQSDGCRRPIICICNDLYTPSLRPLRAMALVINVPEITPSNLTERLSEIMRKEGLQVDSRLLLQLAEKSACDVRACLGILQYTGGGANMIQNLALGLKDMRKGLFDSWKELLQVPMTRRGPLTNTERALKVIKIVYQGEPDRLAQGIFHNYPEICKDKMISISEALNWFEFYDTVNTLVMERQTWMLMPYTTSPFVAWHLYLAISQPPKISYPSAVFEANQKLERNKAILTVTKKTSKIDMDTLVTDVLPFLPDIISPRLRSVNVQLYSPKEKAELEKLVNVMLDFGLSFVQEKRPEGGYEYLIDPNIWDIGTFPGCKIRRPLTYAVKQIVIQELESARLRRAAIYNGEALDKDGKSKKSSNKPASAGPSKKVADELEPSLSQSSSKSDEGLPNHLKQLNPKELEPSKEKKCRNFFQAFQALGQEKLKAKLAKEKELGIVNTKMVEKEEQRRDAKRKKDLLKSDVWFQYKEGYTNAVRRTILMKDFL